MRTSAIIRIIIWALVALILTAVLFAGMNAGWEGVFRFIRLDQIRVNGQYEVFGDDGQYTAASSGRAAGSDIEYITVDWLAGSVEILPHDGEDILFEEQSDVGLESDYQMRYAVVGNRLTIRFARSGVGFLGLFRSLRKTLTVRLPRSLQLRELTVDAVSADITVTDVRADKIETDAVSGRVSLDNPSAEEIKADTVGGRIEITGGEADSLDLNTVSGSISVGNGSFRRLRADTVSGSVDADTQTMPKNVEIGTISGSMTLRIPENDGFRARWDKVSGRFSCDFSVTSDKNEAVYKDGGAEIRFNTVSGSMNIKKR